MEIFVTIFLFALGIFLIVKGGDWFVDAASWIAETSGIPKFIIGATVVSFATTMPELIVSTLAASQGKADMAVGNAVGSVTANLGLIMAISILFLPSVIKRGQLAFKGLAMIGSAALLYALSSGGELGAVPGLALIAVFVVFMGENIAAAKKSVSDLGGERAHPDKKTVWVNIGKFVFGAAGIVIGAQLLVDNGSELALIIGVPEAIISVTMIAIGTSLPELVTTITAIVKKQSSLSVGNILGANIIDITMILPICAAISGGSLPIGRQSAVLDIPVCLFICALAVIPALISQKFRRWQGVALLACYGAYVFVLVTYFV